MCAFVRKKTLGLIGLGGFGAFIVPYLKPYFNITAHNRSDRSDLAHSLGIKWGTLHETASCDVVVPGVPVQFFEETILAIKDHLKPGALVADVSSVKVKPVELMLKHLPKDVEILGTHPLFGPQSGKSGIAGLNMVMCPVRINDIGLYEDFFSNTLGLNIMMRTPELHDEQMAYVQALTHFIGRAVNSMDIPDVEQKTPAYQFLLNIKRNLGQDSLDLFYTIENENPYAKKVRDRFLSELEKLKKMIEE